MAGLVRKDLGRKHVTLSGLKKLTFSTVHICINVDGTFYLVTDLAAKLHPHQNTIIAVTLTNTVAAK